MARVRHIKPGFFTNDVLAEAQPLARLLFAGLWTVADREGRLEDRPKRIKAELLPYDDCNADALLNELAALGFIVRYSVGDLDIIQVVHFDKHQRPHDNEQASNLPPIPGDLQPRTPSLATKDTIASAFTFNSIRTEPELEQKTPPKSAASRAAYPAEFEQFWKTYPPGHGSKSKTYDQWRKLKPAERDELMAIMPVWLASDRWRQGMVKDATAFVRDQFWTNPPPSNGARAPDTPFARSMAAIEQVRQTIAGTDNGAYVETTGTVKP